MTDYAALARELNEKILEKPDERLRIIKEFYSKRVQAGDGAGADFVLTLRSIAMADPNPQPPSPIPPPPLSKWPQYAGFGFGLLTLLFFMALVIAAVVGFVVPPEGKFPVLVVFALGSALSASFLTGYATMTGQIPFFGNTHPVAVGAGGGIAVLFIILLIGYKIYL
jgi:hypothetical protein